MICPSCGTHLDSEKDQVVCYRHNNYYCVWCAHDSDHNCGENKADGMDCKLGNDYDIPFIGGL